MINRQKPEIWSDGLKSKWDRSTVQQCFLAIPGAEAWVYEVYD